MKKCTVHAEYSLMGVVALSFLLNYIQPKGKYCPLRLLSID